MPVFFRSARAALPAYFGGAPSPNVISAPFRCTVPLSGISSRLMQRNSVVLPEPEGPTSTVVLCSAMSSDTPFNT